MVRKLLRSPLVYFGGKGNFVSKILQYIPPHKIYVEVFGGGASLLFAKEPSQIEVYNDIWWDVVNFFRVLQDSGKFERFYNMAVNIPHSREEFYWCKEHYNEPYDEVEKARVFFILSRQSFGGSFANSWGYSITQGRNMSMLTHSFISTLNNLSETHNRLKNVQIENDSFERIIEKYDSEDTFFYFDPPYVQTTRKAGKYNHEMTDEQHKYLVDMLMNIKGEFILSGYENEIYAPLNSICKVAKFETICYSAGKTRYTKILGEGTAKRKQSRTEVLWVKMNRRDTLWQENY